MTTIAADCLSRSLRRCRCRRRRCRLDPSAVFTGQPDISQGLCRDARLRARSFRVRTRSNFVQSRAWPACCGTGGSPFDQVTQDSGKI